MGRHFTTTKNVKTGVSTGILPFFIKRKKDSREESFFLDERQADFRFCMLRITNRVAAISARETGSTIQAFWTKPARM